MLTQTCLLLILLNIAIGQGNNEEIKQPFNAIETFDTAMREQCARYNGRLHKESNQTKLKSDQSSALQAVFAQDVLSACAPIFSLMHPQITERLTVTSLNPLKVKAHVSVPETGEKFSFEGLVCDDGFGSNEAAAVCRTLGFSGNDNMFTSGQTWIQGSVMCTYQHEGTGAKTMVPCRYLVDDLTCPYSASNLQACQSQPLFESNCGSSEAVRVYCN
ncbi:unnamed protein product [Rotaria sordida]|uniref:SRCR domain-containing protein n=1 Tax=Rotaria sordida TaxID=392033 RepID=A0A819JWQ0_9BILA|nr:unnamed protein product [Rotaria sordida]CAF1336370.1 unnamed protein product [Rotaria sordida]CAF1376571.1 unnamed protein product [Rotaria sordida]CAF1380057.1 unnamed protein product [Rotaria sordida]CAF1531181.1 unnamed protein product [Rotaria sordida]